MQPFLAPHFFKNLILLHVKNEPVSDPVLPQLNNYHFSFPIVNVMKCPTHTFYNPSQGACVDAKDSVRMDCYITKRIYDASVLQMLRNK